MLGFCWRLWLARATFFNTDEAWHYSVANQDSLLAAYKASLTLAHPPLLVFLLYFWRHLGTSDAMLRLPGVLAGSIFCWIFYKWLALLFGRTVAWCGLIFASFLPPMIALSAELRQYSLMLMFAVSAAYLLERALADDSIRAILSCVCLYLAMLSHYSAFLFAAGLGAYAILRMCSQRPATAIIRWWVAGQVAGVVLAWLLYATHISKLGTVYPVAQPLQRFADFYLADWYFHAGREHLVPFLYRGTFGVFRFVFGQTAIGQLAALLFLCGVVLLVGRRSASKTPPSTLLTAVLLTGPFVLCWIAVVAGLYPYGRTRQCIFLAVFALAGVSVALAQIARNRIGLAVSIAVVMVAICQAFGTLQGRDMLPLSELRHEHMDQAIQFIRSEISPDDVIFTDRATSFQLRHYLCRRKPVLVELSKDGLESFRCEGLHVLLTGPNDGALTAETVAARAQSVGPADRVWVVQAGWASGLGEALRSQFPAFSKTEIHSFGRYIEVFRMPSQKPQPAQFPLQR
jgi:Dolichyl-phosphate-mannose-protein mannosyltransferase